MRHSARVPSATSGLIAFGLLLSACNFPGMTPSSPSSGTAMGEATAPPEAGDQPTTSTTSQAPEATSPAAAEVEHKLQPEQPAQSDYFITDRSSAATAEEARAVADHFDLNVLERPFTAEAMQYRPHLDLTRAAISTDSQWFYVSISLEAAPPQNSEIRYGVELDLDIDGGGDWLIWGHPPDSSDWTVSGVVARRDQNDDVGGADPVSAEDINGTGDGYETVVFESGQGPDPDAAWIRLAPDSNQQVQIAFKRDLIDAGAEFLWGVWADAGITDPTMFDYHDNLSLKQAGSPVASSAHYPLDKLALLDNTCRWTFGFSPQSPLPGLCPLPATATPAPTTTPTPTATPTAPQSHTISAHVFQDENGNGVFESEPDFVGADVVLRQHHCATEVYRSDTSNASGNVRFTEVPAGTYCVELNSWPDKYEPTTPTTIIVDVGPNDLVYFGLRLKDF